MDRVGGRLRPDAGQTYDAKGFGPLFRMLGDRILRFIE
ncbi:MAG: hypothetical protein ACJASD_000881 [Sphingomonas echinoides]|jgi:hypothetical protein